jgi:hypothetical protein
MPTFANGETNTAVRTKINDAITLIDGFSTSFAQAEASAASAVASAAAAGAASGRLDVGSFAQLSTKFNYTGLSGRELAAEGDIILWREMGAIYEVQASGSLTYDFDYTGSGGIKLSVRTGPDGRYNVMAFGVTGDGVTNDATAAQIAINKVCATGGELVFPDGTYLFTTQVTIDRAYININVRNKNVRITGYGAMLKTSGAISAFNIAGSFVPNIPVVVEGFVVNHRNNTTATAGFDLVGTSNCRVLNNSFVVSSGMVSTYAAIKLRNTNPADDNTACFWNEISGNFIRPYDGADGMCPVAILLEGPQNATTLRANMINGPILGKGIVIKSASGYTSSSNATLIDGNFFEGLATAIELSSNDPSYGVPGTRIVNNRFESITSGIVFTSTAGATSAQNPTMIAFNYVATGSVTDYIVNTPGIPYCLFDSDMLGSINVPAMRIINDNGLIVENIDAAYHPLTVRAPNNGKGINLRRYTGDLDLGGWTQRASAGSVLSGASGNPIYQTYIGGLSASATEARNLTGAVSFSSAATKAVTFVTAEPDANYCVIVTGTVNETFWVTGRGTGGFTINSSNATSTAGVFWMIARP